MEMGALSDHRRAFYGRRRFFLELAGTAHNGGSFLPDLDFVKSQSTSFEKHNDTITAKRSAARRYRSISWHRTLRLTFPTRSA